MRKVEYREGPKAKENFERGMRAILQVPKDAVFPKKNQSTTSPKPKNPDKA